MSAVKEPLFHVVKRDKPSFLLGLGVRAVAIVLGLLASAAIIVLLTGLDPLQVFATIWDGALGKERYVWETLRNAAILLCISFAVMPAFRMRFWNTGAEGQVLIATLATAAVMYFGKNLPAWAMYTLCPVAGIAAGMIWAVIPAIFKAKWNTNETLFTLMMNYVATQVTTFSIIFMEQTKGANQVGSINAITRFGWLPDIQGGSRNAGKSLLPILIVVGLGILLYIYMRYTKQGYEISVVGESESTAHYAGIKVSRVIIRTMALCGILAGVAGYLLAAGVGHTVSTSIVGGRGFTAIIVAWLGKLNPLWMFVVSFFLVFLEKGSGQIATKFQLDDNVSAIITGVLLFFILGCEFFINYRLEFRKAEKEEALKA